jgi:hypothetical protein
MDNRRLERELDPSQPRSHDHGVAREIIDDAGFGRINLAMMRAGVTLVRQGNLSQGYGFIRESSDVIAANTPDALPGDGTMPRIMRDAAQKFFPAPATAP